MTHHDFSWLFTKYIMTFHCYSWQFMTVHVNLWHFMTFHDNSYHFISQHFMIFWKISWHFMAFHDFSYIMTIHKFSWFSEKTRHHEQGTMNKAPGTFHDIWHLAPGTFHDLAPGTFHDTRHMTLDLILRTSFNSFEHNNNNLINPQ